MFKVNGGNVLWNFTEVKLGHQSLYKKDLLLFENSLELGA